MNDLRTSVPRSTSTIRCALFTAILIAMATLLANANPVSAHAELVRTEPPIDGLAVSAPDQISLTFTEEVETSDPPPAVTLLDQQGNIVGDSPLPVAPSGDPRTLVLDAPELDRGTYTVSWTVTSATDAHTLSGTYAFRVGGGLPPGLATSEGDSPAAWAITTRWITFLGASVAVGLLLFGEVLAVDREAGTHWRRLRSKLILGAAVAALVATIAEPVIQWLLDDNGEASTINDVVSALPDGWWWRPGLLIPLTLLAFAIAYPMRGSISRPTAWVGGVLALGSLLGLAMTSHAAGRDSYRWLAILSDLLHQWSVALWCGGLAALVVWTATRSESEPQSTLELKRFSTAALVLFTIAVVTGLVNAGFVFPFVDEIRSGGWSLGAFDSLWTSSYGIVLLVKILALLVPLALAIRHRSLVVQLGRGTANLIGKVSARFRRTLRIELAAVAIVILGGSTIALSAPPAPDEGGILDRITLISSTTPDPDPNSMLVHLTIDPAQAGDNTLTVRLTTWEGGAIANTPTPRIALDFTSLDHGTTNEGVNLQLADDGTQTYTTAGLNLSLEGWWQIDAKVMRDDLPDQSATFLTLLPDPNTQGFRAPPRPETDPAAEVLFSQAYDQMLAWERVRWTENLGSGSDVLVRGQFAVIDGGDTGPSAYSLDLVYSAGFEPLANGDPPKPPAFDSRSSITVGDQGWLRTATGQWLEESPTNFATPAEWDTIYAGASNIRMGISQSIDGVDYQVVTFYLPEQPTQAEAWLAWWIDASTGDVMQITMIARQHYMVWQYTDVNGDFTIERPVAD